MLCDKLIVAEQRVGKRQFQAKKGKEARCAVCSVLRCAVLYCAVPASILGAASTASLPLES